MNQYLPPLREEIALLPGPRLPDGQPTWTLHDPVRNLFYQLDWPSFEILSHWRLDDPLRIVDAVTQETTLHITLEDVGGMLQFLQANQLLQTAPGCAAQLAEMLKLRRGSTTRWLLHNYLFFRIPLIKPDRWLSRWHTHLDFFFSRTFLHLTLMAAVAGVVSVYREWEPFSATLVDMLSWEGVVAYGLTIAGVKTLHELGHGFTAKRYGCRVPTMGLAFLVLWPVAYTDTNEVWKLTRRDQRLHVAAAGIVTELTIAIWATLAWAWLPDGGPKSIAFLLSTTTWVSTIVINASPFMRFDGYFLVADYFQLPNLHARAFAIARWDLRERLFALGEPAPEHFPKRKQRWLILFAWATWLYRLTLFLGIAVLVYQFFIKAVGIGLFLVEIVWFVFLPIWTEIRAWRDRWPAIRQSRRARHSAWMGALLFTLFVVPWPTRITTSDLLQPRDQFVIYAPEHARIATLPVANGVAVASGAVLLEMSSPNLQARSDQSEARRERLSLQSASAGFDPETRKDWQVLNEQLLTAQAEESTISADTARYAPTAPYEGVLRDLNPDIQVGDWVGNHEVLGRLISKGPRQVVTYVDGEDIQRIAVGDRALFISDSLEGPTVRLEVTGIDRDASRTLTEPELATLFGGHIQVREKNGVLHPERTVYRVSLKIHSEGSSRQHSWRGKVTIAGNWEAPGLRFLRSVASVMWREFGF